jgi:asparagine synthase (glutamine-hydrolysing)
MAVQGEPFGSTSIYAQYLVMREAKNAGIKVMLDGQGADEILGGYPWHQGARVLSMLRAGEWRAAYRFLKVQSAWPGRSPLGAIAHAVNYGLSAKYIGFVRNAMGYSDSPPWMNRSWFTQRGVSTSYPLQPKSSKFQLGQVLKENVGTCGLAQLLRYEDRNSMAWSIESRVPFLTTDLVNSTLSLPEEFLIGNDGLSKRVMRAALRGIVPDALLDRRDKIGFATPELAWLRQRPDVLQRTARSAASIECLNAKGVGDFCDAILTGRSKYNSSHIWKLINFVQWHNQLNLHGAN